MFEKEPNLELEEFRKEIQTLKEKEAEETSGHFSDIDPSQLDEKDMEMYKKYVEADDSNLDEIVEDFKEYRRKLERTQGRQDSKDLAGYLGNKLMGKLNKELLKE